MTRDGSFCVLPFVSFNTEVAGAVRPCCENGGSFGDARSQGLMTAWNSGSWRALRRAVAAGHRHPSCAYCWNLEDQGLPSYRQLNNRWHRALMPALTSGTYDAATGALRAPPRVVVLKLSSLCNLACRMCIPAVSTGRRAIWNAELERVTGDLRGDLNVNYPDFDALLSELRSIGPQLSQISFSGGEPFIDPRVSRVLETLRPWARTIRFYANTSLSAPPAVYREQLALLREFKERMISLSVDGPPPLHAYIRPGLDLRVFAENLAAVRAEPSVEIHSNTAVFAGNVLRLPDTFDWIVRTIRPVRLNISLSTGPGEEHQDARVLPQPVRKDAVSRLVAYRDRAALQLPPRAPILDDVRTAVDTITGFLSTDGLSTETNLRRMATFFRELDRIHGSDLAMASPELAEALAGVPDFTGVAPVRRGSVAGSAEGPPV